MNKKFYNLRTKKVQIKRLKNKEISIENIN